MVGIGGADQREIVFIGNSEENTSVGILAEIGLGGIEHFTHDNVRSPHQPDLRA